jgi:pSer/pThr/pTyr-binding forkhead associated (FHA) protein
MAVPCFRCGEFLPEGPETGSAACPRCGSPRPDPARTQPFSAAAAQQTIESRAVTGGTLASGKRYALVLVDGALPGQVIPIEKPRVTLGRAGCDVVLDDPELSRQHALISINGSSARLEDLGSTNGTFVDEERIEHAELDDRSEFRIGSHHIVFVVRDEAADN